MLNYVDVITERCRQYYEEKSAASPLEMAIEIMKAEGFPMHSPHHHYLVPAVLVTAASIAEGTDAERFEKNLKIAEKRGMKIPGAYCGECGTCGAGVGCGIFASAWNDTTPMSKEDLGTANMIVSRALHAIGSFSGPRCCKRVTFLAIGEAVKFADREMDVHMKKDKAVCVFSKQNETCLKTDCPFYKE